MRSLPRQIMDAANDDSGWTLPPIAGGPISEGADAVYPRRCLALNGPAGLPSPVLLLHGDEPMRLPHIMQQPEAWTLQLLQMVEGRISFAVARDAYLATAN